MTLLPWLLAPLPPLPVAGGAVTDRPSAVAGDTPTAAELTDAVSSGIVADRLFLRRWPPMASACLDSRST